MVAEIDRKYLLIKPNGEEQTIAVLDDVYMTISGGKKYYYMNYNNQKVDVTAYLDQYGVNENSSKKTTNNDENSVLENDISNDIQTNQISSNTSEVIEVQE